MTNYTVIDTNFLLDNIELTINYNPVLLSSTLRELEKHKSNLGDLGYKARKASRFIEKHIDKFTFDVKDYAFNLNNEFDPKYIDNIILQSCRENNYSLITNDLLLKYKAKGFGIPIVDVEVKDDDYVGYKEVTLTDEEIAEFYQGINKNSFNLFTNQYLVIKNHQGDVVEYLRWDGNEYHYINQKGFSTTLFGKFKPYDIYQLMAMDSLLTNQMTMIKGKAGSGKSLLALNYAMSMIERNKYDKLVVFVNPLNSRGSAKLGFYPGSRNEKLLDSAIGSMLASKFGDKIYVQQMITSNKLILLPMGDIRGFDTTGMKAITYIVEAQNMNIDLMKLAIQRVGDDSKLIIDGDYQQQVDSVDFEGYRNGMRRVSEVYRGQDFYGEVELPIIYRSRMAKVADLM